MTPNPLMLADGHFHEWPLDLKTSKVVDPYEAAVQLAAYANVPLEGPLP